MDTHQFISGLEHQKGHNDVYHRYFNQSFNFCPLDLVARFLVKFGTLSLAMAHLSFYSLICSLRNDAEEKMAATQLFPPAGPRPRELLWDPARQCGTIWYERNKWGIKGIRLFDKPQTLSGDILRLNKAPPLQAGFLDINGNDVTKIACPSSPLDSIDDDDEDVHDLLSNLSTITYKPQLHFAKRSTYRSEITNLLHCQGGRCPGTPLSPHIVQLLGIDSKHRLLFKKMAPWRSLERRIRSVTAYKRSILQIISGLEALHSIGIVHRDFRLENLLFDEEEQRVVICDLESRWGNRLAPELHGRYGVEDVWTAQTDIFDLGLCIRNLIYMKNLIFPTVELPLPAPFDKLVEACTRRKPEDRPSLNELRSMVEHIHDDSCWWYDEKPETIISFTLADQEVLDLFSDRTGSTILSR